jgi:sulfofructose kinase
MSHSMQPFDVVGLGLNATDTLILVPQLPPYGGKALFTEEILSPGGQIASAMVCCARLGLRTRYIGAIGDDERGRIQWASLQATGIDLQHVFRRANCPNQSAYILIDQQSGERTVFWNRPESLALHPDELTEAMITDSKLLHIDGHDTDVVAKAARIARLHGIPVTMDVDHVYPGFEKVLPNVDYLIASSEFPVRWTGLADPFSALAAIQKEYGLRCAAMTLGADGVLARMDGRFHYSPGFVVDCVDTTGAGDVFHGAFCYAVVRGLPLREALAFSCALAALNCTAMGARGGIASEPQARKLMAGGRRRERADLSEFEC